MNHDCPHCKHRAEAVAEPPGCGPAIGGLFLLLAGAALIIWWFAFLTIIPGEDRECAAKADALGGEPDRRMSPLPWKWKGSCRVELPNGDVIHGSEVSFAVEVRDDE